MNAPNLTTARCNLRRFPVAGIVIHTSRPRIAVTATKAITLAILSVSLGATWVALLKP